MRGTIRKHLCGWILEVTNLNCGSVQWMICSAGIKTGDRVHGKNTGRNKISRSVLYVEVHSNHILYIGAIDFVTFTEFRLFYSSDTLWNTAGKTKRFSKILRASKQSEEVHQTNTGSGWGDSMRGGKHAHTINKNRQNNDIFEPMWYYEFSPF